jgi:DNA-binding transcriptional MerR regulator
MSESTQPQRRGRSQLKPSEVCSRFDVQPYVLKFWESEFPQLGRRLGPKRVYGPQELKILEAIHELVEQQGLNLGEAREALTERFPEGQPSAGAGAEGADPAVPGATAVEEAGSEGRQPAAGGLFGQAEARIRELEKELEQARTRAVEAERSAAERAEKESEVRIRELQEEWERRLAEASEDAERRVRAIEEQAEARVQQQHAAGEQRLAEMQQRVEEAESARAAALARADDLESQLAVERGEREVLAQQVEDLGSLVEEAGDAERRLEAAREESETLRQSFKAERQEIRERDARLAEEVGGALDELRAIEELTGTLLEEISGKALSSEAESREEASASDTAHDGDGGDVTEGTGDPPAEEPPDGPTGDASADSRRERGGDLPFDDPR